MATEEQLDFELDNQGDELTDEQTAEATPDADPATQGNAGEAAADDDGDAQTSDDDGDDARTVSIKALREEREKRQERDQQIARLEGKLEAIQNQGAQTPAPIADNRESEFFSDPVGYTEKLKAEIRTEIKNEQWQEKAARTSAAARKDHDDYDEMEKSFLDAAGKDPLLQRSLYSADNPAEFAYNWAKTQAESQKYGGDIAEMRSKMRDEIRAELEDEARKAAGDNAAASTPKTTARARGSGVGAAASAVGDTPLEDIGPLS